MLIDPVKSFNDSPHRVYWHDVTASSAFASALQTALLSHQLRLGDPPDVTTASANYFRIQGARQLAQILANLTEAPQKPKPPVSQNLSHKV